MLHRHAGQWPIAVCGGDGLLDPQLLQEAGLNGAVADRLAKAQQLAEASLPAAQRAKFSTFDGLMRVDAAGHHP